MLTVLAVSSQGGAVRVVISADTVEVDSGKSPGTRAKHRFSRKTTTEVKVTSTVTDSAHGQPRRKPRRAPDPNSGTKKTPQDKRQALNKGTSGRSPSDLIRRFPESHAKKQAAASGPPGQCPHEPQIRRAG